MGDLVRFRRRMATPRVTVEVERPTELDDLRNRVLALEQQVEHLMLQRQRELAARAEDAAE